MRLPDSEVFRFVQLSKQVDTQCRFAWFNLPRVKLMLTKWELAQVKWSNFPRCVFLVQARIHNIVHLLLQPEKDQNLFPNLKLNVFPW